MPATNFPDYAGLVTDLCNDLLRSGEVVVVTSQVDERSLVRGYLSGILVFADATELHYREFLDFNQSDPRLMYAYHYQNADGALIFRYDNAAHRPPLSQVEHKHTPEGVIAADAPTLQAVIAEILKRA